MEKRILAICFITALSTLFSCSNLSKQQQISNSFWGEIENHNNSSGDSILVVNEYKKTTKYELYWSKYKKCPIGVLESKKKMVQRIDKNTVYINREAESTDYMKLLLKNKIRIVKDVGIDDSFDGFIFIFKTNKSTSFIKIKTEAFFDSLQVFSTKNSYIYLKGEDILFDTFVASIWGGDNLGN